MTVRRADVISVGIGAALGVVLLASFPLWRTERASQIYTRLVW